MTDITVDSTSAAAAMTPMIHRSLEMSCSEPRSHVVSQHRSSQMRSSMDLWRHACRPLLTICLLKAAQSQSAPTIMLEAHLPDLEQVVLHDQPSEAPYLLRVHCTCTPDPGTLKLDAASLLPGTWLALNPASRHNRWDIGVLVARPKLNHNTHTGGLQHSRAQAPPPSGWGCRRRAGWCAVSLMAANGTVGRASDVAQVAVSGS